MNAALYKYPELYFTTATIKGWKHLLKQDKYKEILTESMNYLVEEKNVLIFAFVIMPNHIHLVWQILDGFKLENVQQRMLKYVAQQIKFDLEVHHPMVLAHFKVERKDRKYQFWKERPLSIDLYHDKIAAQKIDYIHFNPVQPRWKLAEKASDYRFSSASLYETGTTEWAFLTHFWH
jgi:putative transposase